MANDSGLRWPPTGLLGESVRVRSATAVRLPVRMALYFFLALSTMRSVITAGSGLLPE